MRVRVSGGCSVMAGVGSNWRRRVFCLAMRPALTPSSEKRFSWLSFLLLSMMRSSGGFLFFILSLSLATRFICAPIPGLYPTWKLCRLFALRIASSSRPTIMWLNPHSSKSTYWMQGLCLQRFERQRATVSECDSEPDLCASLRLALSEACFYSTKS